ncbi:MAG: acyloxyacyl hydrolase [Bacteroidales bacterium]|nr:acyloxyacyl hydrolase [Bacteroidales bacterium]MBN2758504.1 acyloxyacyl hydrolase [Bacteroidales bacterium]
MNKNISLILIITILFQIKSNSQNIDSTKNISISAKYSSGYIYAHHESFKYFIKDYVKAFETNIGFRTKGDKNWQQIYKYPTLGLGYYYADLGNPDLLGKVNAIFPYISIPIIESNKFILSYKFSEGIAWLNKKYDLYDNKYNIAIGSHLNVYINLSLESKLKIAKKTFITFGFGITHYSNGGTWQPNKGFNIVSFQTGFNYNFHDNYTKICSEIPKFKKQYEYSVILSSGFKNIAPARETMYPISSLSINAKRQFSNKGMFGIGIDVFYDKSRIEILKNEGIENPTNTEMFYSGAHFSYDFVYGKMSFTTQMGVYIIGRARSFQTSYNRFGLSYRFDNKLIISLNLKTYWAAADFVEWGIGYRIIKNKSKK